MIIVTVELFGGGNGLDLYGDIPAVIERRILTLPKGREGQSLYPVPDSDR